jgi:ABC-type sugar transport system ATPase subunit
MMKNDQIIVQRRKKIRQTKTKNMLRLREKNASLTTILG